MTVNYNIFNQQLTESSDSFIVSGSRNFLELHFNFSNDWDIEGLTRFVQFSKGDTVIEEILPDDGNIIVPSSVLADSDDFYLTVYGMLSSDDSDILITTNKIAVNLHEMGMSSANTTDEAVVPLWERVWNKLTELISSLHKISYSGKYSDLENKPELSAVAISGEYSDLEGTPALATVAETGDYNDLENKPELFELGDTLNVGNFSFDGREGSAKISTKQLGASYFAPLTISSPFIEFNAFNPTPVGEIAQPIKFGGSRLTGIGNPTADTDATTKKYVDGLVGDISTALTELHSYAQRLTGGEVV